MYLIPFLSNTLVAVPDGVVPCSQALLMSFPLLVIHTTSPDMFPEFPHNVTTTGTDVVVNISLFLFASSIYAEFFL
jgi:hypothetical protein